MEGRYANYFKVGHNENEVVIDFGQHYGEEEPVMHTRIVISSAYLNIFVSMLQDTVERYSAFDGAPNR